MVAYSNPVRQHLFNFEDCGGGTKKAPAAAEALRRIYPGVDASGHVLSIPMPGHAVGAAEAQQVAADVEQLTELVRSHDVIYLLTDTRESRWLPTLLATAARKLTITVALGFDSLVVMRHGLPPAEGAAPEPEGRCSRLGCYFCNDVRPAEPTRAPDPQMRCPTFLALPGRRWWRRPTRCSSARSTSSAPSAGPACR